MSDINRKKTGKDNKRKAKKNTTEMEPRIDELYKREIYIEDTPRERKKRGDILYTVVHTAINPFCTHTHATPTSFRVCV